MNRNRRNQNRIADVAIDEAPNPHLANDPVINQDPTIQSQMFDMNPEFQEQPPIVYLDPCQNIETAIPYALNDSASIQSGLPMNQYTPTLPPISGVCPGAPV
mmetsp:Transcript_26083/g.23073  ORF Transcript_26083/g.23073 Transcript_26083/m.23073 type:complete len:102 (+) Transcript_26083:733-1038(+)